MNFEYTLGMRHNIPLEYNLNDRDTPKLNYGSITPFQMTVRVSTLSPEEYLTQVILN